MYCKLALFLEEVGLVHEQGGGYLTLSPQILGCLHSSQGMIGEAHCRMEKNELDDIA
jgi:hypothetical protein